MNLGEMKNWSEHLQVTVLAPATVQTHARYLKQAKIGGWKALTIAACIITILITLWIKVR